MQFLQLLLVDLSTTGACIIVAALACLAVGMIMRRIAVAQRMHHVETMELQRYQHAERMRQLDEKQKAISHDLRI